MRLSLVLLLFVNFLIPAKPAYAQTSDITLAGQQWHAWWICAANDPGREYGVYHFRKKFEMAVKPTSFIIHVFADNRYKLYVNGTLVSLGPARGDTYYWNYETVDIAPWQQDQQLQRSTQEARFKTAGC